MARVLYLLACAAPPVQHIDRPIRLAQERGWDVCLGMTPTAAEWTEQRLPELARLTGHPVRVAHRTPGKGLDWPPADVTIVAPATLNTINAAALGLTPTWVTAFVCEAVGKRWPVVLLPCVNSAFATHPQFGRSVDVLRAAGVRVLLGPGGFEPNPPGQGKPEEFPWHLAIDTA
ncbi:flavoprotein [Streptomyces sp. 4N509B]|uniref:flavoprotein n=1 Tax=Streptomyces sp. 4N509B TaxID=3457413 RepID=UPI003FCF022C